MSRRSTEYDSFKVVVGGIWIEDVPNITEVLEHYGGMGIYICTCIYGVFKRVWETKCYWCLGQIFESQCILEPMNLLSPHIHIPSVNTLRPRQNDRHFTDDTFKRIFLNEDVRIAISISLKFVPRGPIYNCPALVQIMAWRRSGDKPLSEPMMVSLLTHIYVTRPQWVSVHISVIFMPSLVHTIVKSMNSLPLIDAILKP